MLERRGLHAGCRRAAPPRQRSCSRPSAASPVTPHPRAGATPAERMSAAACSTTDHMPRDDALQMLEESCPGACGKLDAPLPWWSCAARPGA